MKTHLKLAAGFCGVVIGMAGSAGAQTAQKTAIDLFASVKPGQWVKIEGAIQKDFTLIAKEVKILTGDFQDDDWEIEAPIRRIADKAQKKYEVLLIPVKMQDDATYESEDGSITSFDGLKTGLYVEIEGTYMKDGTFMGEEVQPQLEPEEPNVASLVGKAEKVDAAKKTITLMGVTCQASEKTKVKSAVK